MYTHIQPFGVCVYLIGDQYIQQSIKYGINWKYDFVTIMVLTNNAVMVYLLSMVIFDYYQQ